MTDPLFTPMGTHQIAAQRGVGNGPVAGRFVLFEPGPEGESHYITSWDTWEECRAAFPIEGKAMLEDGATGRVWRRGDPYEWEAAST